MSRHDVLKALDRRLGRSAVRHWAVQARNAFVELAGVRLFSRVVGSDHGLGEARRLAGARRRRARTGVRPVLFLSPFYWPVHLAWEVTLEQAVRAAGHPTVVAGCGGLFPQCDAFVYEKNRAATCATCRFVHRKFFELLGGEPPLRPADLVDLDQLRAEAAAHVAGLDSTALRSLEVDGRPVGAWALASVTRHLRTAGPGPGDEAIDRDFVASTIIALRAYTALLDRVNPSTVVVLNGKFFAQRVMLELARERGIEVVSYERGNVKNTLVFGRNRPAVPFDVAALWPARRIHPLTAAEDERLDDYLRARIRLGNAQVPFFDRPIHSLATIRKVLRLDDRPFDVLFTNLIWDSAVCGEDLVFPSMFAWLRAAVTEAARTPERLLVIRAHPAEVKVWWQPTRATVAGFLQGAFPRLPENVRLVPPESEVDSYALMAAAETGLVYTSSAGMEMAIGGRPVLVAARAVYRGAGFTFDPETPAAFAELMARRGRLRMNHQARELARRFAHLVYFEASVPIPWVDERGELGFRFTVESFAETPPALPFLA
ncbi:MAG: hypothetical protein JXQ29_02530, partial [Planctomycetes bacterium]|nr:hypothetical protein [Planctomycetota bacterium]